MKADRFIPVKGPDGEIVGLVIEYEYRDGEMHVVMEMNETGRKLIADGREDYSIESGAPEHRT